MRTPSTFLLGLRIGGAFLAMAVVLAIFTFIHILKFGWVESFHVTARFILIMIAAALVGAFATVNKASRGSVLQITGLIVALLLIFLGRVIPDSPIMIWPAYLLPCYAAVCFIASLLARMLTVRS